MVEIFKTDINREDIAQQVIAMLNAYFPKSDINFDLEDCDRILRIETETIAVNTVERILKDSGFYCKVLD
ncbi:hypothetical protein OOZ15_16565 [Galbibacter sp. EGI 63066]|uniref:hypothetical protein n=1 Tax=Galbibacter sp. EGI 63066 TaxID=2993559 RepID=UPI0022488439|nr:hypothetical protein [Galbibacter sp. EGI 63066]MCX2681569.1 hypothetical protein [Galbibacter sp. EGI 63066]